MNGVYTYVQWSATRKCAFLNKSSPRAPTRYTRRYRIRTRRPERGGKEEEEGERNTSIKTGPRASLPGVCDGNNNSRVTHHGVNSSFLFSFFFFTLSRVPTYLPVFSRTLLLLSSLFFTLHEGMGGIRNKYPPPKDGKKISAIKRLGIFDFNFLVKLLLPIIRIVLAQTRNISIL